MMKADEFASLDATALAGLVRKKQVKAVEIVEAAIERIERLNPTLNAVVTPMFEQAREAAAGKLLDGPFAGVPFLLKDLGALYPGVALTMGTAFLRNFIPDQEATLFRLAAQLEAARPWASSRPPVSA